MKGVLLFIVSEELGLKSLFPGSFVELAYMYSFIEFIFYCDAYLISF